ncbi:hypothetical protein BC938DRAFT_479601 [Jimgerdemannia flammicorona]|uniref:RWD domain-containing protein n=1 Tax=Jimgerdemannia flammicorona TaxID=994334 RepID=A0A433QXQ2_9FUNG|nr:hypothetical protein BC938DRAFT_479601 [Jimgerdemannia flammicorona]
MVTDDDESTNRQLQEDECLALASIFGDSAFVPDTTHPHAHVLTLDLDETQDAPRSPRTLHVRFHFPPTYPSRDPPVHEITSVYCGTMRVTDEMRRAVDAGFRERFVLGEVIVFEWAGWLREYLEERFAEEAHANADRLGDDVAEHEVDENVEEADKEVSLLSTQETAELTSGQGEDAAAPPIAHGEPLVDRRSIFVAHAAPVASLAEVQAVIRVLYDNKRIARATHNIRAYRIVQSDGRVLQDNDDDGETAAGSGFLKHFLFNIVRFFVCIWVIRGFDLSGFT